MTDETATPEPPLSARAAARARRVKRAEQRENCFNFFVSGFSPHEIAKAMNASPATVRRLIDLAIRERRLDAAENYAHVQVARLGKALCLIDDQIERGDVGAVGALVKLVSALHRYQGLDAPYARLARVPPRRAVGVELPPAAPLALTHEGTADTTDYEREFEVA